MTVKDTHAKNAVGAAMMTAFLCCAVISAPLAAAQGGTILGGGACALGTHELGKWINAARTAKLPSALKVFAIGAAGAGCGLAVEQFEANKPATFEIPTSSGHTVTRTLHFGDLSAPRTRTLTISEASNYWPGGRCEGYPVGSFYDICVGR